MKDRLRVKRNLILKNNLRKLRETAGMSQTEVADLVGSSRNTITSIENGKFYPTAYLAALLCKVFHCNFEDIFYLEIEEDE